MINLISLQETSMAYLKDNLKSVSTSSPTIGRLGAFPVATIDVLSAVFAVEVASIQSLALSIFKLVKAIFANEKIQPLKEAKNHFIHFAACTIMAPVLAILSPIAIIDQTIEVTKDPVKNSHYRSNFSFK